AELSLASQDPVRAEADARALLTRFPGSAQRARALTQLAAASWELRRFRGAADFAAQAAGATDNPVARAALRLLAAEASFRAASAAKAGGAPAGADFAAAAEAYAPAVEAPPAGVPVSSIMLQEILSRIEAGRLGEAAETIDR